MELPADILIEAQKRLCDNPGNTCMFGPVADGIFLPENASEIAARGTLWEGSAMIGSSMHELGFYKMLNPDFAPKAPEIAKFLFGKNASVAGRILNGFVMNIRQSTDVSLPESRCQTYGSGF